MNLKNLGGSYVNVIGTEVYDRIPKAVFAAIAVSSLTQGGDRLERAVPRLLREWSVLHDNGIVKQRPPSTLMKAWPSTQEDNL